MKINEKCLIPHIRVNYVLLWFTTITPACFGYTAMSSVVDTAETNKQWAVATIALYNKDIFKLMK